jgi:serine/threonine-protein kinase
VADANTTIIREQEIRDALAPNYIIERELGRGGMGAVYLARDVRLERPVAIKMLPPEMAQREDLRARFLQETRTAASFSHPNIVPVHSVEEHEKLLCFVMGFVDGETLTARVNRTGPLSAADATKFLQECAWALSYAHGRGVVHRDVKPDNILIDRASNRAMVTDFGIARSQDNSKGLTMVGEIIGTPQYMSPEQATGETLDRRSDLYSLGVVAFFVLTGRLPFESQTAHGFLTAHITRPAPPLASIRGDLPPALTGAVDKLLMKDPAQRFQTGEELADHLDPIRSARPEIPPAIRLFVAKSGQIFRSSLLLLLFTPALVNSVKGDADQVIMIAMVLTAVVALVFQAFGGLRELAAQGFSHADLRNGILAIGAEEAEARAQYRAAPGWPERQKRRTWRLSIGAVLALALIVVSTRVRVPLPNGGFHSPPIGIISAILGVMIGVVTLIYGLAGAGGATRIDRRFRRIWTGTLGKRLLEAAAKRVDTSMKHVIATPVGAKTLVDGLPKNLRRDLGDVPRVIDELVARQASLVDREARLTASQTDASQGSSGAATDTLDRVMTELSEAKIAAVGEREAIAAALERIRLEMIRLQSGIGSAADVKREADRAREMLRSN